MTQSSTGNANYARSKENWKQMIQIKHMTPAQLAEFIFRESRNYHAGDPHATVEDCRNLENLLSAVQELALERYGYG